MRRLNSNLRQITVTGMFTPFFQDDTPILLTLEDDQFIVVFSTVENLKAGMLIAGIKEDMIRIKHIDDGKDFIDSVSVAYRVMLDPYVVNGNTRFTEIFPETRTTDA